MGHILQLTTQLFKCITTASTEIAHMNETLFIYEIDWRLDLAQVW